MGSWALVEFWAPCGVLSLLSTLGPAQSWVWGGKKREPRVVGRSWAKSTGEGWVSQCPVSGGCLLRVRGAQAGRAPLGFRPSVLRSPLPGGNLSRPFVFGSPQPGPVLPSHMLLHKLLCCPLLLFPHPPPSSLQCTHTPLPTHSPIVFSRALPQPSGFQMRPAEPPPSSADPP